MSIVTQLKIALGFILIMIVVATVGVTKALMDGKSLKCCKSKVKTEKRIEKNWQNSSKI